MANARAGKWGKIWIGGYHLTTKIKEITPPHNVHDAIEQSGFLQDKNYILGQADAMATINGFFDKSTGSTHAALSSLASGQTEIIVTMAWGDNATPTIGDYASSLAATQSQYNAPANKAEIISVEAAFKSIGEAADFGLLIADVSGASATGSTTSIDNGASSSNGGVGYLHLTGVSASDTFTGKIQHSTNDSTWADLITFTLDGSAIGAERIEVSGTVNRYIRFNYTLGGSAISFDFAATFKRG